MFFISTATLKDEDVEDDDVIQTEKKAIRSHSTKRTSEKQPTGRIVGVIKRNWRA